MPTSRDRHEDDLDEYRISSDIEIEELLQRIQDSRTLVTLSARSHDYTTGIWQVNAARRQLSFLADADDARLNAVLNADDVLVVAFLDSIKVEFRLENPALVNDGEQWIVQTRLPNPVYRFQRRSAFRVRPLASASPVAEFLHPSQPKVKMSLRVLDVSLSGVGLLLPDNAPAIDAGTQLPAVRLLLDEDTELQVPLRVHYVTPPHPETKIRRLGCEFVGHNWNDRALQYYINQTQKRQLAIAAARR